MTQAANQESRLRSVLKAFTWRMVATLTTILIAYTVTGEVTAALSIGGIEFMLKFVIYYLHERIWQFLPSNLTQVLAVFSKNK